MSARDRQAGFTLLEVMIALAILFMALVILIDRSVHDVHLTERAEMLGIATDLTRGKIYDIEEELIQEGFQETEQEDSGDFSDEDRKEFEWKYTVEKIELPKLGGLEAMASADDEGGEGGSSSALSESPLAGLLAMGGGDASSAAGAGFIASQFELISNVLETSIRKVTLTVSWKVGDREEELTTSVHFTDPTAVSKALGGLPTGGNPTNPTNPTNPAPPPSPPRGPS